MSAMGSATRRDLLGGGALGAALVCGPGLGAWMPRVAQAAQAGQPAQAAPSSPAAPGQMVVWPEIRLLDGSSFGAAQARGQAMVVVFWSTTCPFCLRHNAHIEKLRQQSAGRPLKILTVARDKDAAAVQRYLKTHGYGFAVTLDQAAMSTALSTRKLIPLTVTVDRAGRLLQVIPGEMFEEDVMELMRLAA